MDPHRKYARAPITEAVIDIRVRLPEGLSLAELEPLKTKLPDYPTIRTIRVGQGQITIGEQTGASASSSPIGYMFTSAEGHYIFQARLNGFALSRMPPYEAWESFVAEARRLFSLYEEVVGPEVVTRLAVRYINRFDLPGDRIDLSDYFRVYPAIPDMAGRMTGFYLQTRTEIDDLGAEAVINQAIVEAPQPEFVSVILDIDVFRSGEYPVDESSWTILQALREDEYKIFEASITESARELIS